MPENIEFPFYYHPLIDLLLGATIGNQGHLEMDLKWL